MNTVDRRYSAFSMYDRVEEKEDHDEEVEGPPPRPVIPLKSARVGIDENIVEENIESKRRRETR